MEETRFLTVFLMQLLHFNKDIFKEGFNFQDRRNFCGKILLGNRAGRVVNCIKIEQPD